MESSSVLEPVESDLLIADWARSATPPPNLTVSEWADRYRRLPSTSSSKGGRWRTESVPYLRGIMNAVHEPGVSRVAVRKCAQVGGSEAVHNIIGYYIEHEPCPMLVVHPRDADAQEWSKDRLADMLRTSPALAAVVQTKRQGRDGHLGESTLTYKTFPGGFLKIGSANTENTFARISVRIAFGDDVDRFPAVVGEEGDPMDLLEKRTEMWDESLVVAVSTPNLKGGRIDTLFARGDQRQFHVRCPTCGRFDFITWRSPEHFRVTYKDRDPSTARLQCAAEDHGGCAGLHDEPTRRQMVRAGEWVATAEPQDPGLASFHLPAMVTTLGKASLTHWVSAWLTASDKGRESTRVFINTTLGEGWEDRTVKVEPHVMMSRREEYGEDVDVPAGAVFMTAGVDVQVDRFMIQVQAWGLADERWVVDWRTVPGDPKLAETREALWKELQRTYRHASGHQLPIHATFVDTGWATEEMYGFVLKYQAHRVYASKGFAGRSGKAIVGKPSEQKGSHRPVRLYPVNVDDAKADVQGSMLKPRPKDDGTWAGFTHVPVIDAIDEEFFAQYFAEHRETKYNKYKVATHQEWVQDRDRNEALDTAVLCLAAFRQSRPNIPQLLEALTHPPSAPSSVPKTPQRAIRSRYLGG